MTIIITFGGIYVGLIVANENSSDCEVIGAEGVTCKNDLTERANMRSDFEDKMVDIRLEFDDEDDEYIYENRHQDIYWFINLLAENGIVFDQFVITCNSLKDGGHSYHILASVIDKGGYNVNIHNIDFVCQTVGEEFAEALELNNRYADVAGDSTDATSMMLLCDVQLSANRYGGSNPLCHELVLPYRDAILADLTKKLFGRD